MVATLTKRFGNLDNAEDAAAEAFATAAEHWPVNGIPPNPGAWLTTTASRKAIDRIRRESSRKARYREAMLVYEAEAEAETEPLGAIDDDRLRLIFICCHPALAMEARIALTLRMVGGLSVPEIANAFLVQDTTMGARITCAKTKITAAGIPYRRPAVDDLPGRVAGVLAGGTSPDLQRGVPRLGARHSASARGADRRSDPARPAAPRSTARRR